MFQYGLAILLEENETENYNIYRYRLRIISKKINFVLNSKYIYNYYDYDINYKIKKEILAILCCVIVTYDWVFNHSSRMVLGNASVPANIFCAGYGLDVGFNAFEF